MDNVFGYPEPIWQRFVAPTRAGHLDGDAVVQARVGTPSAKAELELSLRSGPPVVARFRAFGCPVTIAVGDWIAERLELDGLAALQTISAAHLRNALEIPEDRAHCSLLGEDLILALRRSLPSES